MFRLKKSSSGYAKNHEVLCNVAACIWDPRWLTICAVIRTMCIKCLISITLLYLYWGQVCDVC